MTVVAVALAGSVSTVAVASTALSSPASAGYRDPAVYGCAASASPGAVTGIQMTIPSCPAGDSTISWAGTLVSPSPSPSSTSPSPTPSSTSPSPSPTTTAPGGTGQILLTGTSLAVDNAGAVLHDGNPVSVQASDTTARSQQWQVEDHGSYVIIHPSSDPAMCLDEIMATRQVDIWGCGGGPNQQWVPLAGGMLQAAEDTSNSGSPIVLTDPGAGGAGTGLTVAPKGGSGQSWTLPSGSPSPSPSPSSSSTGSWAWCTSSNDGWTPPDGSQYFIYNNAWNAGEAGPQQICANSISDVQVTSTQPDLASDPGSVKTYPEIQRNWPDVSMTTFSTMTSTYAETMPTSLARLDAEAAYDIWLGNTSVATTEIMFWTENAGQSPGGSLAASNVSFGGHSWDLWCGGGTGANGCVNGTYFVWALHGINPGSYSGSPSGTVDLLAGMKLLVSDGFFSFDSQHLMRQVNFGWEICSTGNQPGVFSVSAYSLTSS